MNKYVVKKGLVDGYSIGMQNENMYVPVADRDVRTFKKFKGEIEAILIDGKSMKIKNWDDRIIEEKFEDKFGRGEYKIGYFLWEEKKPFRCPLCGEIKEDKYRSQIDRTVCMYCK